MDRPKFYNVLRQSDNVKLTQQNVFGFEKHLDYAELYKTSASKLPYIFGTSYWESGATMHPVLEAFWMSEQWRKIHLRYYPWYGRGLVQTTWEKNYEKIDDLLLLNGALMKDPNLLLKWEYALPALFIGMEKGLYTGKDVDDYIDDIDESDAEDFREMKQARRVVNAMDMADTVANLGLTMEKALKAGKYGK